MDKENKYINNKIKIYNNNKNNDIKSYITWAGMTSALVPEMLTPE